MAEASIPVHVQVTGMALVVGPNDLLVINLGRGVTPSAFQELVEQIDAGLPPALKGRVLIVNAEQLAVVHGAREPT